MECFFLLLTYICLSTSKAFVAVAKESSLSFLLLLADSSSSNFCLYASESTRPPVFRLQPLESSEAFFFFFFFSMPFNNFSASTPTCLRRNLRNSANSSIVALEFKSDRSMISQHPQNDLDGSVSLPHFFNILACFCGYSVHFLV